MSRWRRPLTAVAVSVTAVVAAAAPALADGQQLQAARPPGQVAVSDASVTGNQLAVTITDTRADDPGWSVSVSVDAGTPVLINPRVVDQTAAFTNVDGTGYAEQVLPGGWDGELGSAPRGHGLGIATMGATLPALARGSTTPVTVTVTVV